MKPAQLKLDDWKFKNQELSDKFITHLCHNLMNRLYIGGHINGSHGETVPSLQNKQHFTVLIVS